MVWDEVEPLADVILVNYNQQREDIVAEVILGQTPCIPAACKHGSC